MDFMYSVKIQHFIHIINWPLNFPRTLSFSAMKQNGWFVPTDFFSCEIHWVKQHCSLNRIPRCKYKWWKEHHTVIQRLGFKYSLRHLLVLSPIIFFLICKIGIIVPVTITEISLESSEGFLKSKKKKKKIMMMMMMTMICSIESLPGQSTIYKMFCCYCDCSCFPP